MCVLRVLFCLDFFVPVSQIRSIRSLRFRCRRVSFSSLCFFVHKTSQKMVFLPPPKPPPLRPPVFPDGVRKNNKSKSSKRKRSAEGEDGEKNTGANRNHPNPENPKIGANELIREEKKEVILDEETIRWRNERKKNYPRSSTDKTNAKKTEEEEEDLNHPEGLIHQRKDRL